MMLSTNMPERVDTSDATTGTMYIKELFCPEYSVHYGTILSFCFIKNYLIVSSLLLPTGKMMNHTYVKDRYTKHNAFHFRKHMYSSRYGRPNMANLTGEFGRAVFNHIKNTSNQMTKQWLKRQENLNRKW